jgi:stress response protein YsnF
LTRAPKGNLSVTSNEPHLKQAAIGATDADLPIIEEQLQLDKREVVTGRVRVRTITDSSEELLRQELQGERVEIVRVPVDILVEPGAAPPKVRTEGNVTILPVVEEVLVVERRILIKEELRLIRHATKEVIETPVTLRKQRAVVERLDSEGELITDAKEKQS